MPILSYSNSVAGRCSASNCKQTLTDFFELVMPTSSAIAAVLENFLILQIRISIGITCCCSCCYAVFTKSIMSVHRFFPNSYLENISIWDKYLYFGKSDKFWQFRDAKTPGAKNYCTLFFGGEISLSQGQVFEVYLK